MRHQHQHVSRAAGFSLVELMVALVLGLILMGGVISVYTTSKSTYSLNNALGQVQEAGRFALSYLEPPVRMAGYMGCAAISGGATYYTLKTIPPDIFNFNDAVIGYDANGTGVGGAYTLPATQAGDTNGSDWTASPNATSSVPAVLARGTNPPVKGSDILVMHEAAGTGFQLQPNGGGRYTDSGNVYLLPADADTIQQGEIIIVSDCKQTTVSQVTNSPSSGSNDGHLEHSNSGSYVPGNDHPIWGQTYGKGAQLFVAQSYVFYVGIGADGGPSLYEASLGVSGSTTSALSTPQEVVSGVENMQIIYGIDTDADKIPNLYESADQVTDWTKVVNVRIALVTRSDDSSTDAKPSSATKFILLGDSSSDATNGMTLTAPIDRRLRRVFTETISLRNELP